MQGARGSSHALLCPTVRTAKWGKLTEALKKYFCFVALPSDVVHGDGQRRIKNNAKRCEKHECCSSCVAVVQKQN